MALNEYTFVTRWTVSGTCAEVYDILYDGLSLPRWWPSVYLEVTRATPEERGNGPGAALDLFTKGWLPYTLRWRSTVTSVNLPHGFSLAASGDLTGTGTWTFTQRGEFVDIQFDWRVRADKLLLRAFSWIFKPIFSANHDWAMARGEESLKLELQRRRAPDEATRVAIPPPPGSTFR